MCDVDLNMISLNVKGINNYIKRQKIITWMSRRSPDIIFLQETFSTTKVEKLWLNEWSGYKKIFFSHGSNHSKGVMTLFKNNLECEVKRCVSDDNGRYVTTDVVINP